MPRFDVTTIGEGQLRYSVPAGKRLAEMNQLDVHVTGTELNVVCLLSRLGWHTGWVSGLPDSPLGQRVLMALKLAGVDDTAVSHTPNHRLATYYVEFAHPPRSSQVYYDRANTAFTNLTHTDIDWDYLQDTRLLHISGLTVPLSSGVREILLEAITRAKADGIPVSFDMNYRSRIWTPEEAAEGVLPFIQQTDLLLYPARDARLMYGFSEEPEELLHQLAELSGAQYVVTSLGADGLAGWDGQHYYREPVRATVVVDRIGAGDAMVAGVLHGWLQGDFAKGLRYGALTAALALSQYGDQVITTRRELEMLLESITFGGDITR
ncbi:MAG: sugar kinase [Ardenticatenaceae bacterium]|nr:sugar kinase [Ardenticatenaceae bacterium]MCB9442595.1 sugar kinase [Ardenticatenaceae bacterium]